MNFYLSHENWNSIKFSVQKTIYRSKLTAPSEVSRILILRNSNWSNIFSGRISKFSFWIKSAWCIYNIASLLTNAAAGTVWVGFWLRKTSIQARNEISVITQNDILCLYCSFPGQRNNSNGASRCVSPKIHRFTWKRFQSLLLFSYFPWPQPQMAPQMRYYLWFPGPQIQSISIEQQLIWKKRITILTTILIRCAVHIAVHQFLFFLYFCSCV